MDFLSLTKNFTLTHFSTLELFSNTEQIHITIQMIAMSKLAAVLVAFKVYAPLLPPCRMNG